MKHQSFIILALGLGLLNLSSVALADGNSPLVQNEYAKAQTQLEGQLLNIRKSMRSIDDQKSRAVQEAKAQSQVDLEGLREMKRYYTLLLSRYSNETSQFQPWRVVGAEDVENINKLFDTYLHTRPLRGRVSAGQADRTLDWGMSRLEDVYKTHKSPSTDNNSDLEILQHQMKEAEASEKAIRSRADRLDLKLNEKAIEEALNGGSEGESDNRHISNE